MTFRELFIQFEQALGIDDITQIEHSSKLEEYARMCFDSYRDYGCIDVHSITPSEAEQRYIFTRGGYGRDGLKYRFGIYDTVSHWHRYLTEDECSIFGFNMRNGRTDWISFIHQNGDAQYLDIRKKSEDVCAKFFEEYMQYVESVRPKRDAYVMSAKTMHQAPQQIITPEEAIVEIPNGSRYSKSEWDILYNEYINSSEWHAKRWRVYQRDGFKCVDCGTNFPLECHHLTYERVFNEPLEDLITVCRYHHQKRHDEAARIKQLIRLGIIS